MLGSNVNGLVAWDFSDHYITPRGLNVEDKGLVVQPLMLLFWKLHGSDQGAVSDVTLTTGIWNSFHSHRAGARPSRWNEIDPILGVAVKFRKGFTVDVSTTAFYTPTDAVRDVRARRLQAHLQRLVPEGTRVEPVRRLLAGAEQQVDGHVQSPPPRRRAGI